MSPTVLAGAYFLVGLACAALELRGVRHRTSRDVASAAVTLVLWPLWAPFALSPRAGSRRRAKSGGAGPFGKVIALLWPATVTPSGSDEKDLASRRPFLRALALLAALGLLPCLFVVTFAVLAFRLYWTAHVSLGLAALVAGLLGWTFRLRWARAVLVAAVSLLGLPLLLRAILAGGTDDTRLTLLPGDRGTRLVNTLVPERDGCLFAAGMLGAAGGLKDEEAGDFHAILERAYARVDTPSLRLPTPAIATYLGMQTPTDFDAIVISPPSGAKSPSVTGAVVFLHGFAGNFHVYCWEFAQAARSVGLLTVCPSLDADGAWWTSRGDDTLKQTLRYLRDQGIERVYLAGLSNGAAGASVLALRHEHELSGLILVSGIRAERPPSLLPVLVVQGSRDRMMPAAHARAYAKRSGRAQYHEVPGGHFVFLSKHELVRPVIASFFERTAWGAD
jgi:pimeloyl-ACP methyl ester carboxylesterase